MNHEEEIQRGHRAEQILNDPLLKPALDEIQARLIEEWRSTAVKDVEMREKLWMMFCMYHRFVSVLTERIDSGKFAKASLAEDERHQSWLEKFRQQASHF